MRSSASISAGHPQAGAELRQGMAACGQRRQCAKAFGSKLFSGGNPTVTSALLPVRGQCGRCQTGPLVVNECFVKPLHGWRNPTKAPPRRPKSSQTEQARTDPPTSKQRPPKTPPSKRHTQQLQRKARTTRGAAALLRNGKDGRNGRPLASSMRTRRPQHSSTSSCGQEERCERGKQS